MSRDHREDFLCGAETELLHGCSSVVAEDSAIRLGVQVACKKGLRNVVMESDSLECVLSLADKNAKYLPNVNYVTPPQNQLVVNKTHLNFLWHLILCPNDLFLEKL